MSDIVKVKVGHITTNPMGPVPIYNGKLGLTTIRPYGVNCTDRIGVVYSNGTIVLDSDDLDGAEPAESQRLAQAILSELAKHGGNAPMSLIASMADRYKLALEDETS